MTKSSCTISFSRNDLQRTRLRKCKCPVKNCKVDINNKKVPFHRHKGKMLYLPFCPEHGIRIHKNGFVYYNGSSKSDQILATKRNLMFHDDYYVKNFMKKSGNKMESGRLCYEGSEDAVSYNVFTELLYWGLLSKLVSNISVEKIPGDVELYLWGGKIDLRKGTFTQYKPLLEVRKCLESDIKVFGTEPDIILVVPKKMVICIEAKFGSKNPIAKEVEGSPEEKPKCRTKLIEKYCSKNKIIDTNAVFDFENMPKLFYEQLFRNVVFAASMAELESRADWYVVNLRNQHVMNIKQGRPESMPIMRNMRSILKPKYKKRFTHLTWEEIYNTTIKGNYDLADLTWYLKNKSLSCGRAFNVLD